MDTRLFYWGSITFSVLAGVLLLVNISLANANHTLQGDIQQRQAAIGVGEKFNQLNQQLIQALAESAVKNNNTQFRDLLAAQGLTLKNNEAPARSDDKKADDKKSEKK